MTWIVQPLEVGLCGVPTGRYRLTAESDSGGGGPFGDLSHDHATPEECIACERCDEFVSAKTGFPSRARQEVLKRQADFAEYLRLKAIFEP